MKKTLVLVTALVLTLAMAIPSFAAVWDYPGFMVNLMTDTTPSYTANDYKKIEVNQGTPVIDGKLDAAYKNGVSVKASNWHIYGGNTGSLTHEADVNATAYFLWDDGYFYTCIVVEDSDVSTIGREAILDCYPAGNPWMNDGVDQFFTRVDGSCSFKVGCDAYCILPYFSDWSVYKNVSLVNEQSTAAGRMTDATLEDNGGWWQGDCIGGMWWVEGDVHPYYADVDDVAYYIDWTINENPTSNRVGSTSTAKSRTSTFATTQSTTGYILESAIRMPECKAGFDFMYGYQVLDTDSQDAKFLALTNVSDDQFKDAFHLVMVGEGGSSAGADTTPSGDQGTTPSGDKVTTPAGDKVTTPSGDVVTTPTGDVVTTPTGDKVTTPAGDGSTKPDGNNPATADIFSVAGLVAVAAAACFVITKKKKH